MASGSSYDVAPCQENGKIESLWKRKKCLIPVGLSVTLVLLIIIILLATLLPSSSSTKGFVRYPEQEKICYDPTDPETYKRYVGFLNETIKPYETAGSKGIDCRINEPEEGEVCSFPATWLDMCRKEDLWGYRDGVPCILLTYHQDQEFVPINKSDDLPEQMPKELKTMITNANDDYSLLWVFCSHSDSYSIYQGFMKNYLQVKNSTAYLPPLVAVDFELPDKGVLHVTCSLWGKTDSGKPIAELSFEIGKNC